MDNLAVYSDGDVVAHYAAARDMLPPERYVYDRYVRPGMDILDVGVGGGRSSAWLAPGAHRYLGVDYSPAMIEACRARFPEYEYLAADASDLSMIPDASFDFAIFTFNGIDYLPDDASRRRALAELRRVTRPDGIVVISSHSARQLILVPTFEGASLVKKAWRLARAAGLSVLLTAKTLPRASFWRGSGYVRDPVHGGLHTHVSRRASIAADAAAVGLKVVEAVGAFHPRRVPEWANNWTTYVLRRA